MAEGGYDFSYPSNKKRKPKKAEKDKGLAIYFDSSSSDDDGQLTDTSSLKDDDYWEDNFLKPEVLMSNPPPKPPRVPKYVIDNIEGDFDDDMYQRPMWPPLLAPLDTRGRIASRAKISGEFNSSSNQSREKRNTFMISKCDEQNIPKSLMDDLDKSHDYEVIDSDESSISDDFDVLSREKQIHLSAASDWTDVDLYGDPKDVSVKRKCKSKFPINTHWQLNKITKSSAGKSLEKLGSKFPSMKDLSGNFKQMLNIKDADKESKSDTDALFIPIEIVKQLYPPVIKHACMLYLEGTMGVGKSTLIRHLDTIITDNTVTTFVEPMAYWKFVYTDIISRIYKATKPHRAGRDSTSAEILSCQLKFLTPFNCLKSAIKRLSFDENKPVSPLGNWVVFDRHCVSSTLVFPYMFLMRGLLSFEAFVSLVSCFSCNSTDVVAILNLDEDENLKRLHKRNRPLESVTKKYLQDLNTAYHAVYCSWLLLQYFQPVELVELCVSTLTLVDLCANKVGSGVKLNTVEKLFNQSFFFGLKDVVKPFKNNCTIIEICMKLCEELKKLQFIVVDVSEFTDDLCGLWTSIYMRVLNNPAIKTQAVDWSNLTLLSREYNCQ